MKPCDRLAEQRAGRRTLRIRAGAPGTPARTVSVTMPAVKCAEGSARRARAPAARSRRAPATRRWRSSRRRRGTSRARTARARRARAAYSSRGEREQQAARSSPATSGRARPERALRAAPARQAPRRAARAAAPSSPGTSPGAVYSVAPWRLEAVHGHAPTMTPRRTRSTPAPTGSRRAPKDDARPPAQRSITPLTSLRLRDADRVGRNLGLAAVERLPGRLACTAGQRRLLRRPRRAHRREQRAAARRRTSCSASDFAICSRPDLVQRGDHLGRHALRARRCRSS